MDYIFRWLSLRFLSGQQQLLFENLRPKAFGDLGRDMNGTTRPPGEGITEDLTAGTEARGESREPRAESRDARAESREPKAGSGSIHAADALAGMIDLGDAPSCSVCGSIMVRNGSCYKCMSCGSTSGCS